MTTTYTDNGTNTPNGSHLDFTFTFPVLQTEDIRVALDGVTQATTKYSVSTSPTAKITFNNTSVDSTVQESTGAPKSGVLVRVYRLTTVHKNNGDSDPKAVFSVGSSIRSGDLNNNVDQALYGIAELQERKLLAENIEDNAILSRHIKDGEIVDADINASANISHSKLASGNLPSNITVNSANIVNQSIVNDDISNSANIHGSKLADDTVSLNKLGAGTLPSDIVVTRVNIEDGTIQSADIETGTLDNRYYTETELNNGQLNNVYYTETELDGGQLDNRYYTETELNPSASVGNNVLDARYYTETEAENRFLRQDSSETIASGDTWSASDSKVATSAAIDLRIIDLVDDVGGFVAVDNETSFPTSNPDINNPPGSGTIVSVKVASTTLTAQSGTTLTITNGAGSGNTVTITGVTSTIPSGYGFLVETTSTLHTYTFHRLVPKATEVATIAANAVNISAAGANVQSIHNFSDLYQVNPSAPTQRHDGGNLTAGDLWFDSSSNKVMMVYDGSAGDGYTATAPNSSDLAAIRIVSGQITYTEDLGLITEALTTGSGNTTLNTVAGIASDATTVAGIASDVSSVAADATDIGVVAGKETEIGRLGTADAVADMNTLGTTATVSDMDTLADISSNITTVAGVSGNVTTVAGIASNVTAVAGNATNINAVAADATDIGAVAGKATEIGRLGTADAVADLAILGTTDVVADMNTLATTAIVSDLDTLADISTNITSVANNESNINAAVSNASNINAAVANASNINNVAGNSSNINTLAGIDSNVTTVAGIAPNVTTAAANNANISTVAGNNANITTVAGANSNISTVAGSIANVNTAASNITGINNFGERYRVASSAPGSNNDEGDLYFDTTSNELRVYNGSAWQGGVTATGNLAGLGANTFTGAQTFASGQTFDGRDVSADGAKLDAITTSSGAILNGVTATTQSAGDASTKVATTAYTDTAITNLVDSSPSALNTLNELAAALGDDANFSTTVTNSLATKLATNGNGSNVTNLNADNISSGTLARDRIENSAINADKLDNSAVTFSKFQDVAQNHILGRISSGTGQLQQLSASSIRSILGLATSATTDTTNASNISSGTLAAARVATLNQNTTGSSGSCTGNAATASNAALLDGIDSSQFLRSDADDTLTGIYTISQNNSTKLILNGNDDSRIYFHESGTDRGYIGWDAGVDGYWIWNNQQGKGFLLNSTPQWYDGSGYGTVWHSRNDGSSSGLDADLLDGYHASSFVRSGDNSAYKLEFGEGLNTGHTSSSIPYGIFQEGGAWSYPYPDLRINYHTGIVMAVGSQSYGGLRFQRDYNNTAELMSIGNGDSNVRVANHLYVAGVIYVDNTTNYLSYPNGDYGSVQINGSGLNSWEGYSIDGRVVFMHDGSNSAGIYNDVNNEWMIRTILNGAVELYYNNNLRLYTTSAGASVTGSLTASGNVTAYSDARLKTNVNTIDNALDIVDQLRGVSFDWIKNGEHSIGVIAQEVEEVLPELVVTSEAKDPDTEEIKEVKSVDYGKMVGVLINAIKELKAEVAELKEAK